MKNKKSNKFKFNFTPWVLLVVIISVGGLWVKVNNVKNEKDGIISSLRENEQILFSRLSYTEKKLLQLEWPDLTKKSDKLKKEFKDKIKLSFEKGKQHEHFDYGLIASVHDDFIFMNSFINESVVFLEVPEIALDEFTGKFTVTGRYVLCGLDRTCSVIENRKVINNFDYSSYKGVEK